MKWLAKIALGLALFPSVAFAQSYSASQYPPNYSSGGMRAGSMTTSGGIRTQLMNGGSDVGSGNPLPVSGTFAPGTTTVTPSAASNSTITTGGTAVTVFAANTTGTNSRICNPSTATEVLFVNSVTTATTTVGGTNEQLAIGQCWYAGAKLTTAVTANAATSGHVFTAVQ